MIVSGGENVYPIEVEKTLTAHHDVAEAAVIGVDDEQYGQRLVAFVVLTEGATSTPDDLSSTSGTTSPTTRCRARSPFWTSCPATSPARCCGANCRPWPPMAAEHSTLVRAALELANAANAVRPIARKGYITIPLFLLGWPTSELAPWLLGDRRSTRAAEPDRRVPRQVRRDRADVDGHPRGLLATIHRRNLRSAPRLEEPLREALGADDTEALPCKLTLAGRSVALRVRTAALRGEGGDNSAYGPHRANRLDIWRRRGLKADAKAPVLVNVPGGAWVIGMRRPQAYPLMGRLAAEGWMWRSCGRVVQTYSSATLSLSTLATKAQLTSCQDSNSNLQTDYSRADCHSSI